MEHFQRKLQLTGIKRLDATNPPVERSFIGRGIDAVSSFVTG
jgi:hypothetical protein